MGEAREYTFEELRRIVGPIAAEYGMIRVYLFGSRARGDNRPDSDYDFCVVAPEGMGLFKMGGFYGRLEEALGAEVDIVSERALSEDFSREVLRDRILLYEARHQEHRCFPEYCDGILATMDLYGDDIEDPIGDESYRGPPPDPSSS